MRLPFSVRELLWDFVGVIWFAVMFDERERFGLRGSDGKLKERR